MLNNIIKNTLYLGIGQGISGFLYFLAKIFLARRLGPEKFGMFSFAESVFLFFSLIVIFGSDMIGAREIAQRNDEERSNVVSQIISIRLYLSFIVFIILILFTFFIKKSLETKLLIVICGFAIFSFIFLLDWFFWGLEKFDIYAKYTIIRDLFFLLSTIIIINLRPDILYIGIMFLFSKFVYSFLLFIKYLKSYNLRLRLLNNIIKKKNDLLNSCNALFWATMAGWIVHNLGISLIGIIHKDKELGYYSAASTLIFYIVMVITVFLKVIFPLFSKNLSNLDCFKENFRLIIKYMYFILLPILIVIYIFGKNIIFFIYGQNYLKSVIIFKVLIFFILIMSINMIYSYGLIALKKEEKNLKINLILGGINIALDLLLIPTIGTTGAAWSRFITQIIISFFYKRELRLTYIDICKNTI